MENKNNIKQIKHKNFLDYKVKFSILTVEKQNLVNHRINDDICSCFGVRETIMWITGTLLLRLYHLDYGRLGYSSNHLRCYGQFGLSGV